MNKKGIVMEIHKNKIGILTSSGEFIYVANSTVSPNLGEIYESEEIKLKSSAYKNIKKFSLMAASLLIIFICSIFIKTYNAPVSSVTIKINPSIKLQANRWNKIINVTPLNKDGTNLLKNLNLKNKGLEKRHEFNEVKKDYNKAKAALKEAQALGDADAIKKAEEELKSIEEVYNTKKQALNEAIENKKQIVKEKKKDNDNKKDKSIENNSNKDKVENKNQVKEKDNTEVNQKQDNIQINTNTKENKVKENNSNKQKVNSINPDLNKASEVKVNNKTSDKVIENKEKVEKVQKVNSNNNKEKIEKVNEKSSKENKGDK
ncbi:anti-sigma factor domain-containing protein [Clostridium sporogenes]|uniref:anti-sigma factor domain-containing protein n=1 Tax=Clostridium sporogenes TaxID=1509 RepID=UPI0022371045|nr:anti-sigma factor domain-containing protein [Clostridium sporogenes]MCW6108074.1 anti-sigma factor domain-containing protein [Clostridium sporogenes]